ncbi:2,3-diaminopropionate biosynthesis protein SbnB [Marinactinospora thermotolerans]|uniref:2,3-diaminopropionate biosynthesis protein SbnB n=1 Tax=Marinactinospora thermotolerans TaxID=531310 RepID=UPI003D9207AC
MITGSQVESVLSASVEKVVGIVEEAYLLHDAGASNNPPSYFLRFADRPSARIIALPASIGGRFGVDGLKWISSFPENVDKGIPRASAVLVLNDPATGYPLACLESSIISAARTAASAALAADHLSRRRGRPRRVGFVGTGLIARYVHTYLAATGWSFDEVGLFDLSAEHARGFRGYLRGAGEQADVTVHADAEALIRSSDLVVFATVAATPHVHRPEWFDHAPIVLHLSLRDLGEEVILAADNIVDDLDHCLKAQTSPHLVEQRTGNRDFITGTLADILLGRIAPAPDRPLVFSPFGLGILDLAVGRHVYDRVTAEGEAVVVPDFFHDLDRHGNAGNRPPATSTAQPRR